MGPVRWRAEEEKGVLRRQWAPEKGGEEVRANDGWAPRLVVGMKGVHRRGAHQGNRVLVSHE